MIQIVMVMWQCMNMEVCLQDTAASVSEMEAKSISQAFAAVAEGGHRQAAKYKALLAA